MRWKRDDQWWVIPEEVETLIELGIKALKKYLGSEQTILKGDLMADYQLNAGDSVVVTLTDTDAVTGAAVTPDAGSVSATLSSATDTVVVDPSGTFLTVTAGTADSVGNTVTVDATVGGVASTPWVGTYDVVAVVPDATVLLGTFGTETPPAAPAAPTLNALGDPI